MKHLALLLLLLPALVMAQPEATGYNGTVAIDSTVTYYVTGHGTKTTPGPVKFATFEEGSSNIGTQIPTVDTDWESAVFAGGVAIYANAWAMSGSVSAGCTESRWGSLWMESTPDTGYDRLFISGWYNWLNVGTDDAGEGKGPRLCSGTAAGGGSTYNSLGAHVYNSLQLILGASYNTPTRGPRLWYNKSDGTVVVTYTGDGDVVIPTTEPYLQDCYVKLSTPGSADGVMQSTVISENYSADRRVSVQNRDAGQDHLMSIWYASIGTANTQGDHYPYMDDVHVDYTPQRLVIGDAETYVACGHASVQICTGWDASSVTAPIRYTGAVATGDTLWAFVFDADNLPSDGLPIIWGGEGQSGPPDPPAGPTMTASRSGTNASVAVTGMAGTIHYQIDQAAQQTHYVSTSTTVTIPFGTQAADVTASAGADTIRSSIAE